MTAKHWMIVTLSAVAAACGQTSLATGPTSGPVFVAPAPSSPGDLAQLSTLRPTLSVKNGSSDRAGERTYEFEISDKSDFSSTSSSGVFPALAHQTGVAENAGGTTSFTPDFDMQPATRLFWRARVVQDVHVSDWTPTRSFNTAIVGYNRAGELFDPLINGSTIGTVTGPVAFIDGQGLKLIAGTSYVRYQLAQPLSSGEFSLEIGGLSPNGPGPKLKLFSMSNSTALLFDNPWLFDVQYRGVTGNPDNAISWKMRLGDPAFQLEPDFGERAAATKSLDPAHFYFFKATWNNGVRIVIQDNVGSGTIYDLEHRSTDYLGAFIPYQPSPHFAYLGANDHNTPEAATFPGEIVRNVFIGNRARPATLGNAIRVWR